MQDYPDPGGLLHRRPFAGEVAYDRAMSIDNRVLVLVLAAAAPLAAQAPQPDLSLVPGIVISYSPASSGQYIGSPGIVELPNGEYIAKHDYFGPNSTEKVRAVTRVFRSADKGKTWRFLTDVQGLFWSSVFVHKGELYMMGASRQYGDLVIVKSPDRGQSWSEPKDAASGLLAEGRYHTAPMPMPAHDGRYWRAFEDGEGPGGWGQHFRAFVMSAPTDADLMKRESWTFTNRLGHQPEYLGGEFGGWLEGNAVVTPDGGVVDLLRVSCPEGGKAAMIHISKDGKTATFDPAKDFVDLPGGAKKFTVRYDRQSRRYWSLTNLVPPKHAGGRPSSTRNTLALVSSPDLRNWTVHTILLYHPDPEKHGFQYVDWLFDGNDIIAASRTAYDDGVGGAHNMHDANFLTFHRFRNFRKLKMKDSVVNPRSLGV